MYSYQLEKVIDCNPMFSLEVCSLPFPLQKMGWQSEVKGVCVTFSIYLLANLYFVQNEKSSEVILILCFCVA